MTSVVENRRRDGDVLVPTSRRNASPKVGEEDSTAVVHTLTQLSDWRPVLRNTYMEIKCVKFSIAPTDLFQLRLKLLPHFVVNLINKFLVGHNGFQGVTLTFA